MGITKLNQVGDGSGDNFQGHEEKDIELLLQVDNVRQTRRIEAEISCKKTRF